MAKQATARNAPGATKKKEISMHDTKKAQEMLTQSSGKVVETMTVWADANQRADRQRPECLLPGHAGSAGSR